jgi:hypothetical protein
MLMGVMLGVQISSRWSRAQSGSGLSGIGRDLLSLEDDLGMGREGMQEEG